MRASVSSDQLSDAQFGKLLQEGQCCPSYRIWIVLIQVPTGNSGFCVSFPQISLGLYSIRFSPSDINKPQEQQ